jgi:hypothetical protein
MRDAVAREEAITPSAPEEIKEELEQRLAFMKIDLADIEKELAGSE